jgi:hypothetical protein
MRIVALVIPAKAGIPLLFSAAVIAGSGTPAFAGVTEGRPN